MLLPKYQIIAIMRLVGELRVGSQKVDGNVVNIFHWNAFGFPVIIVKRSLFEHPKNILDTARTYEKRQWIK